MLKLVEVRRWSHN